MKNSLYNLSRLVNIIYKYNKLQFKIKQKVNNIELEVMTHFL